MARKSFKINDELMNGIEQTLEVTKQFSQDMQFNVINIGLIEPDPENPRDLLISKDQIKEYISGNKNLPLEALTEIEGLNSLAESIRKDGVINPVIVYEHKNIYRLVAGERRTLASLLAGKEQIQAKILPNKPSEDNLRLLQWVENIERKDLNIFEKRDNLFKILGFNSAGGKVSIKQLIDILGCSKSQAAIYKSLVEADEKLISLCKEFNVDSLKKVDELSRIKTYDDRVLLLTGRSSKKQNDKEPSALVVSTEGAGRKRQQVNFGATKNVSVAKKIISILKSHIDGGSLSSHLEVTSNDMNILTKEFEKLIKKIEKGVESNDK